MFAVSWAAASGPRRRRDEASPAIPSFARTLDTTAGLSPEALTNAALVDARSDIYSLGAVAYYMLTAEPVFTGASVFEVCLQHLTSERDQARVRPAGPTVKIDPTTRQAALHAAPGSSVARPQRDPPRVPTHHLDDDHASVGSDGAPPDPEVLTMGRASSRNLGVGD